MWNKGSPLETALRGLNMGHPMFMGSAGTQRVSDFPELNNAKVNAASRTPPSPFHQRNGLRPHIAARQSAPRRIT